MFTQCSNCQTVFKLSAEVLRAAGGQVRCGRCGEVFSALARLAENASAFDVVDSSLELEQHADSILETAVLEQVRQAAPEPADDYESDVEIAHLEILDFSGSDHDTALVEQVQREFPAGELVAPEEDLVDTSMEFTLPPGELDRIFIESKHAATAPFPAGDGPEPVSANPFVPPLPVLAAANMPADDAVAPPPPPQANRAPFGEAAPDDEPIGTEGLEVIADHRVRASAGRLVAESVSRQMLERADPEYDRELNPTARPARAGLWLAAAVLLALLLASQLVHQHRQYLAEHGPLREVVSSMYRAFGAPLVAPTSLAAYQLRQWGVTGDPTADGTLKVRASILNTAAQMVPYPLLRVTLANRYGARIGARDFEPAEYLGQPTARLLSPGERVDATLAILDPGKDAEGFEIDVCVRSNDKNIVCANDSAAPAPQS